MRRSFRLILLFCQIGVMTIPAASANRFENDIAAFEAQDRAASPRQGQILFLGSSSIRLWDLARHFPDLDLLNRGFGGSEISDSIYFFDRVVLPYRPRAIVFYAGDNDIAGGKEPARVATDFRQFAEKAHAALPLSRILYLAIKPSPIRWHLADSIRQANDAIRRFAEGTSYIEYVDFYQPMIGPDGRPKPELFTDDNLHLNEAGYRLWTDLLRPRLTTNR